MWFSLISINFWSDRITFEAWFAFDETNSFVNFTSKRQMCFSLIRIKVWSERIPVEAWFAFDEHIVFAILQKTSNLMLADRHQILIRQNQIWSTFCFWRTTRFGNFTKQASNLIVCDQNQSLIRQNKSWSMFCLWWTHSCFFFNFTNRRQIWFSLISIKFWSDRIKFEARFAFDEK
jgi:hypothetical protein